MKEKIYFIFLLVLIPINSNANTPVLISEYRNTNTTSGEWIELLIIEDNVSIVGYYLRDNSTSGEWMGGVVFNDIPLWRNLRKGTAIVINTRGSIAHNINANDGYIEIDAENSYYFTKRSEDGALFWQNCFNFSQQNECIQILDSTDNHLHALAQSSQTIGATIAALPQPKVIHIASTPAASVRFWGFGGAAYNQISGSDSTSNSNIGITKGFANQGHSAEQNDINQLYWRSLRQPLWSNPVINAPNFSENGILISWNKATDPFPDDNTQGYLILRHLKEESINATLPEDSKVYAVGSKIGSATVIANITSSQITQFNDMNFRCGDVYIYRIFAYRYDNSGDETDNMPLKGRGRSYNELDYAIKEIATPIAEKAVLHTIYGNYFAACTNDSIVIYLNNLTGNNKYEWQWNNNIISAEKADSIVIEVRNGINRYNLRLINELNCITVSDEIVINGAEKPNAEIIRIIGSEEIPIIDDKVIVLCKGENAVLKPSVSPQNADIEINWYRNDILWESSYNNVIIDSDGEYFFVAANQNACFDTSAKICILFREYDFSFEDTAINFIVNYSEQYIDKEIKLNNHSEEEMVISKDMLILTNESVYSLQEPMSFPIVIPPKSSVKLVLRFSPDDNEVYQEKLILNTACGSKYIDLLGYRIADNEMLTAGSKNFEIGRSVLCEFNGADTTITITAIGNHTVLLKSAISTDELFVVDNSSVPAKLSANESFELAVGVDKSLVGKRSSDIKIPYKELLSDNPYDTLVFTISFNVIVPELQVITEVLDFGTFSGCSLSKDTIISVANTSDTDIFLTEQPQNNCLQIKNLPITILQGQTADIDVSVFFNEEINDYLIDIPFLPCGGNSSIQILGNYERMRFSSSKDTADFGYVFDCQEDQTIQMQIEIANIAFDAEIYSIELDGTDKFSIDGLYEGMKLSEVNNYTISINSKAIEKHQSYLKIKFSPCYDSIVVPIIAHIIEFEYDLLPLSDSVLLFSEIEVGESEVKEFHIRNNNPSEMEIHSIDISDGKFCLIQPKTEQFPISIKPNEECCISIEYSPDVCSLSDTASITLTYAAPCRKSVDYMLIGGNYEKNIVVNARLELPALTVFASPGELANFNLSLHSKSIVKLSESEMNSLKFTVNYNPTLLFPSKIKAKGWLEGNVRVLTATEIGAGKLRIEAAANDMSQFIDGVFAEIELVALLGDKKKTKLIISDIEVESSNQIEIESTVGEFELTGDCMIDGRLIYLGEAPSIIYVSDRRNSGEIRINHIIDGYMKLAVYDVLGNQIELLLDKYTESGKYVVSIDNSTKSNGMYFILYEYAGGTICEKILIY